MSRRYIAWLIPAVFLSLIGSARCLWTGGADGDRMPARVSLDGVAMGGWSTVRAARVASARADYYLHQPVILHAAGFACRLRPSDAGVLVDWRSAWTDAAGRKGRKGFFAHFTGALMDRWTTRNYPFASRVDRRALSQALGRAGFDRLAAPAGEARLDTSGRLIPASPGWRIDLAATARNLRQATLSKVYRRAAVVYRLVHPASADYRYLLSSYVTPMNGISPASLTGIRRIAQEIDGRVIPPGRLCSFQSLAGPETAGEAGGQTASALYNAALLAGLPIVERHSHTFPPSFAPMGRDAAVHYPYLDLRFLNDTEGSLMILAAAGEGRLVVGLAGMRPLLSPVTVSTRLIRRLPPPVINAADPRAATARPDAPGYLVRVSRSIGGHDELVALDVYHPSPRVIGRTRRSIKPRTKAVVTTRQVRAKGPEDREPVERVLPAAASGSPPVPGPLKRTRGKLVLD